MTLAAPAMKEPPETDLTPGRDALKLCLLTNLQAVISMTKAQEEGMPAEWQLKFKDLQAEYFSVFPSTIGMHPDKMVKMDDLWQSLMASALNEYLDVQDGRQFITKLKADILP